MGDGSRSISELLEELNLKRANNPHNAAFKEANLDDPVVIQELASQGFSTDSIPERGHKVWIRRNSNLSTGGLLEDWSEQVHPDNARLAEQAAKAVNVDICGVDLILPDVTTSWREAGGVICEVNATAAAAHDNGGRCIAEYLVPDQGGGCIPKIVFLTDKIKKWDPKAIGKACFREFRNGAWLMPGGVYHAGAMTKFARRMDLLEAVDALLMNREVEAIAIPLHSSKLLPLAASIGPVDILVGDIFVDTAGQQHLPFLREISLMSLEQFLSASAGV